MTPTFPELPGEIEKCQIGHIVVERTSEVEPPDQLDMKFIAVAVPETVDVNKRDRQFYDSFTAGNRSDFKRLQASGRGFKSFHRLVVAENGDLHNREPFF